MQVIAVDTDIQVIAVPKGKEFRVSRTLWSIKTDRYALSWVKVFLLKSPFHTFTGLEWFSLERDWLIGLNVFIVYM